MPLVKVSLSKKRYAEQADDISAALHAAQVDALDVPVDDFFQVFTPHDEGQIRFSPTYLGVDRQDLVVVEMTVTRMFSVETKGHFWDSLVKHLEQKGIRPSDVLVAWTENNGAEDWYAGTR